MIDPRPSRCLAVAMAVTGASFLIGCGSDGTAKAGRNDEASAPRQVRVVPAVQGGLPRVVTVTGTLAAEEEVVLGMKVAGKVGQILVDLGSRVSRGQVLARLSPVDFELRVRQAEAILEQSRSRLGLGADDSDGSIDREQTSLARQARAMLDESRLRRDRAQQLYDDQLLSRADLDTAQAEFLVAEGRYQDALEEVGNRQGQLAQRRSELALARQQLADSVLTAPFDGAVQERHVSPGQYVAAGQPIVTLVRVHPLRLRLAVPERDAASLRQGQEVRLTVEGDPQPYHGRVARLSPAIAEGSRTLMVEAEVPNPDGALRPGTFATASVVTSADEPVIFVPASSIVSYAGIEKVIVVHDGKTVEKRVRTGRRHQDQVEIVEGIAPGDDVVVEPGNLVGGQAVTVTS